MPIRRLDQAAGRLESPGRRLDEAVGRTYVRVADSMRPQADEARRADEVEELMKLEELMKKS